MGEKQRPSTLMQGWFIPLQQAVKGIRRLKSISHGLSSSSYHISSIDGYKKSSSSIWPELPMQPRMPCLDKGETTIETPNTVLEIHCNPSSARRLSSRESGLETSCTCRKTRGWPSHLSLDISITSSAHYIKSAHRQRAAPKLENSVI